MLALCDWDLWLDFLADSFFSFKLSLRSLCSMIRSSFVSKSSLLYFRGRPDFSLEVEGMQIPSNKKNKKILSLI